VNASLNLATGPMKLVPGDYLTVELTCIDAGTLISGAVTWFTLTRIGETGAE
jgi:hypothetical protein